MAVNITPINKRPYKRKTYYSALLAATVFLCNHQWLEKNVFISLVILKHSQYLTNSFCLEMCNSVWFIWQNTIVFGIYLKVVHIAILLRYAVYMRRSKMYDFITTNVIIDKVMLNNVLMNTLGISAFYFVPIYRAVEEPLQTNFILSWRFLHKQKYNYIFHWKILF